LFIKTNNGEGNNKDFYYEWDIHNYKKFAINDFESDITASGYKWYDLPKMLLLILLK